jgi:hypothetical protein
MEEDMKKSIIFSCLIIILTAGLVYAHGNGWGGGQQGQMRGPGMMGGGYGGQMMGPGMMGGGYGGPMMGPGMRGGGYGGQMMGPGMMGGNFGSCPCGAWFGQNYQNNDAYQKFMDDTVDLRKELNNKRFEYSEMMRNPNASPEDRSSLEKEIFNLQQQLQEKASQYR